VEVEEDVTRLTGELLLHEVYLTFIRIVLGQTLAFLKQVNPSLQHEVHATHPAEGKIVVFAEYLRTPHAKAQQMPFLDVIHIS